MKHDVKYAVPYIVLLFALVLDYSVFAYFSKCSCRSFSRPLQLLRDTNSLSLFLLASGGIRRSHWKYRTLWYIFVWIFRRLYFYNSLFFHIKIPFEGRMERIQIGQASFSNVDSMRSDCSFLFFMSTFKSIWANKFFCGGRYRSSRPEK